MALGKRGKVRAVDLCEHHRVKLVQPLDDLLKAHGRSIDGATAEAAQLPELASAPAKSSGPRLPCPVCGASSIASALPGHIFKVHLKQPGPPLHKQCPECRWRPPKGTLPANVPRQVGQHRKHAHGRSLLDDAREALAKAETLDAGAS